MSEPLLLRLARWADRAIPSPARRLVRAAAPRLSDRVYGRLAAQSPVEPQWVTVAGGPLQGRPIRCSLRLEQSYYLGTHEPAIAATVATLRPGTCVIDIGGHIGYTAMLSAAAVGPTGRVLVFEPLPSNRARIAEHLAANPDLGAVIDVVPLAVSDRVGTAHMAGAESQGCLAEHGLEVQTTTLDAYVTRAGIRPALIKMDIEGAESCVETLAHHRPILLVELHDEACYAACAHVLETVGYRLDAWTADGWTPSEGWRDREVYRAQFG